MIDFQTVANTKAGIYTPKQEIGFYIKELKALKLTTLNLVNKLKTLNIEEKYNRINEIEREIKAIKKLIALLR